VAVKYNLNNVIIMLFIYNKCGIIISIMKGYNMSKVEKGMKFDKGKLRFDLITPYFYEGLAEGLTFGAKKYKPNNWMLFADEGNKYIGATLRHLISYRLNNQIDEESGVSHLALVATNLMFLYYFGQKRVDENYSSVIESNEYLDGEIESGENIRYDLIMPEFEKEMAVILTERENTNLDPLARTENSIYSSFINNFSRYREWYNIKNVYDDKGYSYAVKAAVDVMGLLEIKKDEIIKLRTSEKKTRSIDFQI